MSTFLVCLLFPVGLYVLLALDGPWLERLYLTEHESWKAGEWTCAD